MHKTTLLEIDLHLFDGAAGGAAPAGDGSAQAVESTPKADVKLPGSSRRAKSGAYENVVFGKQEDAPAAAGNPDAGDKGQGVSKSGVETTSNTLEDRRKAFKEMIGGEYKDVYAEEFQKAFNHRFKEVKGMEQSLSAQKPILDMLLQRYNIADGDMAKLQSAIEQDDHYWEEAADEAGLTVEQYRNMKKLERENAELKLIRQRQQGEQQAQQKLNQWYAEAEQVKSIYPTFDFKAETADKEFIGMLKAGLSVQKAYEVKHMDEIKAAAAQTAAQTAGEQMKARIQERAARPSENGTSSQGAVIVKNDVHNLSRADRAEAVRRAQRGEIIRW
jgi:hypothetical protein